jgi:thiol-disulfide isomerase/thioredoxin
MRKPLVIVGALVLVAVLVVGFLQARSGSDAPSGAPEPLTRAQVSRPLVGAPAALAALHGRVNELRPGGAKALDAQLRELRGHPVVVNLWASWCDPCRFELPYLQRQAVKRGATVAFLGVNSNDDHEAAAKLADRFPMPYPSFEDPRFAVAGRYGARGLPVTAFYDAKGKLTVHQGVFSSEAKLSDAIERYALDRS